MTNDHPFGKPEVIFQFTNKEKVNVFEEPLRKLFQHEKVKNRKIVAFSLIGAYRKGKSFLLDYCLRYLYSNYESINCPSQPDIAGARNWMGEKDQPLKGFSWRSGAKRDTSGVVIWSDAFLHTVAKTGEKIAIIVIDTQGLFDKETSPMDNSRIFALGTLISSIQVLNLTGVIQEDQLQYLQFATEFAKFTATDNQENVKPFQSLMVLIRDWEHPDDFLFGTEGGMKYLRDYLEINEDQKEELKSVRKFIDTSFENLSGALLPHPGKVVAGGKIGSTPYDGNWGSMDQEFKHELSLLIEHLLSADKLVVKKINGTELNGTKFCEYFIQYLQLFQSDKLPATQTIYESTIEKQMYLLIADCVSDYKQTLFQNQDLLTTVQQIPMFHEMSKNKALILFNDSKKMGNLDHAKKFYAVLQKKIKLFYKEWSNISAKNIETLQAERENVRLAMEEKRKIEFEQIQNEKRAAEKLAEMEKFSVLKAIEQQEILKEMEVAKMQLKIEHENKLRIESEKHSEEKETLLKEQYEKEKEAGENLVELERKKMESELEMMKVTHEKDLAEARLQAEQECSEKILVEKKLEEQIRKNMQMELQYVNKMQKQPCPIL